MDSSGAKPVCKSTTSQLVRDTSGFCSICPEGTHAKGNICTSECDSWEDCGNGYYCLKENDPCGTGSGLCTPIGTLNSKDSY
ncbi:MAG: hypothetical protein J6T55_04660 [Alphaproteobacteria bacterium]|nr:hypothetical protein [Alphaproteobacteria bacterium]